MFWRQFLKSLTGRCGGVRACRHLGAWNLAGSLRGHSDHVCARLWMVCGDISTMFVQDFGWSVRTFRPCLCKTLDGLWGHSAQVCARPCICLYRRYKPCWIILTQVLHTQGFAEQSHRMCVLGWVWSLIIKGRGWGQVFCHGFCCARVHMYCCCCARVHMHCWCWIL